MVTTLLASLKPWRDTQVKSCARESCSYLYLPLTVKTLSSSFMESSSVSGSCFDFVHTFQILIKESWAQLAKKRSSPICFQKKKGKKKKQSHVFIATTAMTNLSPFFTCTYSIIPIFPIFPVVHSIKISTVLFQHQLIFPFKFSIFIMHWLWIYPCL